MRSRFHASAFGLSDTSVFLHLITFLYLFTKLIYNDFSSAVKRGAGLREAGNATAAPDDSMFAFLFVEAAVDWLGW